MTQVTEGLRNLEAEQRLAEKEARPSYEKTVRPRNYNYHHTAGAGDIFLEGKILEPKESKIFGAVSLESQAIGIENGEDSDFTDPAEVSQEAKKYRDAIKIIESLSDDEDPYEASQKLAASIQARLDAMQQQGVSAGETLQYAALQRKLDAAGLAIGALGSIDYQFTDSLNDKITSPIATDTEFIVNKEIRFFNELAKNNAEHHKNDSAENEAKPSNNENVAKDILEARSMLAHSPDLMAQLIAEVEAFKNYRVDAGSKGDSPDGFDREVRILEGDIDAVKSLIEDWAVKSPSQSLEEYIEDAQDIATDKADLQKLSSYVQIKNNFFFRDRQIALLKRMDSSKTGDGSTAGSLGFENVYFK